jgi:hypothetical protein
MGSNSNSNNEGSKRGEGSSFLLAEEIAEDPFSERKRDPD